LRLLEYVLFAVCLCVIALRVTFTEGPSQQSIQLPAAVNDTVYSLSLSGVLIFAVAVWFVWSFCTGRFVYRISGLEIGLALFCIASAVACFAAADKRAAITGVVTLLAPFFMAVLLVQILDSHARIALVLICIICIAALGVTCAWQSAEQYFVSNAIMIEQYERDPQSILGPIGIQPGTFNQMLLEHRILSQDVRAFFTTGNSAGSFAILATFAALAVFAERLITRGGRLVPRTNLLFSAFALAANIFALFITHSKGAISAAAIALVLFFVLLGFGNWFSVHRKVILTVCLLLAVAAGLVVVAYGVSHDRLPGGNSMLVRWQYWRASTQMIADHPLTGVGPGNFSDFYRRYKPASAPETVSDPHCLPLSILTQYGPLGLIGFLLAVLLPLLKVTGRSPLADRQPIYGEFKKSAAIYVGVVCLAMLLIRPLVIPESTAKTMDEKLYIVFTSYLVPAVAFVVGFWLLSAVLQTAPNTYALAGARVSVIALSCALFVVLIHNLIDYAILEPGVFTTFCAVLACVVALDSNRKVKPALVLKSGAVVRITAVAAGAIVCWAYLNYALLPVAGNTAKIAKAKKAARYGQFELAHNLLDAAAEDDPLDPKAPLLNGRIYLDQFGFVTPEQPQLLLSAEQSLFVAAQRNPADYRSFDRLFEVYTTLAQTVPQQRDELMSKAFESSLAAVELYPGSAEICLRVASAAEQLGKTDTALEYYKKAVAIEDGFREQFRLMYPNREVFSRLGEEKYALAKKRIEMLSPESVP